MYCSDKRASLKGRNFTLAGWHWGNIDRLYFADTSTSEDNEIVLSGCEFYGGSKGGVIPINTTCRRGHLTGCSFQSVDIMVGYLHDVGKMHFTNCVGNQLTSGWYLRGTAAFLRLSGCTVDDSAYGILNAGASSFHLENCSFGATIANGVDIELDQGIVIGDNVTLASATQVNTITQGGAYVSISRLNGTNANKTWTYYGTYERETSVVRGGSNGVKMTPSSTTEWLEMPFGGPDEDIWGAFYVLSGQPATVKLWVRKSQDQDSDRPTLVLSGQGLADTAEMTDVTDEWEELTVSGTPTSSGMAKLVLKAKKTASQNYVYADDLRVKRSLTDSMGAWSFGAPGGWWPMEHVYTDFGLRTDELVDAIRTMLGSTITVGSNSSNINSKPEGHPMWWIAKAKYPLCVILPVDAPFEHAPRQSKVIYGFSIFYVMEMADANTEFPNPHQLCRKRAEVLLGRLEADKTLGLSYVQDSYPLGFSMENELNELFREEEQRRVAAQIDYAVEIVQSRS